MSTDRSPHSVEIVTAVMLGLISVVTALGALQSAVWTGVADEFERDSIDARDVSVNQSVLAEYARRVDTEASAEARRYAELASTTSDPLEAVLNETLANASLNRATPGLAAPWGAWRESGFSAQIEPLRHPDYLAARDGRYQSYGYTAGELAAFSDEMRSKSSVLAQASLIQALALFLFGIAGVNRLQPVRIAVLGLGMVVFLGGLALASAAF
ncbi:hypothetical protein PYV02_11185 [Leifsonia sp. H3M29-4]|uniref:hypothetical protein n=1 Tax=Salinibacterium metalliresistens TaxID=3031321 RepID=UPI0023DBC68D|nr:hypothetical protein [Salinibacterium metalliresistens]MDF1479645.1 hypothetical protein [Salinibacterium metalliresistens]